MGLIAVQETEFPNFGTVISLGGYGDCKKVKKGVSMGCSKEELLNERVFNHFYQICQIPHPSGGEKALSDFILNWALKLGLDARQDSVNNVFIRKPATPGYESAPAVMLQAHIDMVCEKNDKSAHDFTKDPVSWVIDGDIISTGGQTTLGADDGIGVSYAMAVLEDQELEHPALEVLFTVAEESDFTGAENFDMSWMKAEYLINLDHACDREILSGSCGGMDAEVSLPVQPEELKEDWRTYNVMISGLKGGHSGEDIHRGHGNANSLLGRFLAEAQKRFTYGISAIKGGTYRLAIPREARADLSLAVSDYPKLEELAQELESVFRGELQETSSSLKITVGEVTVAKTQVAPDSIVTLLLLAPDGICQMNEVLTGLVDTSDNLGELHMDDTKFRMVFEIRSAQDSLKYYIYKKIERLAALVGAECKTEVEYASWHFRAQSPLRETAVEVYRKLYDSEPSILTVHAGLEVGCFFEARPTLDAIALGPDCWNFHSPSEMVSISSTRKTYQFLCSILKELK